MHEPAFWHRPSSLLSRLLAPLAALYGLAAGRRMQRPGTHAGVPVICVGNYHVGGAGKTPTVLALVSLLRGLGERPAVLSRGYGGAMRGPLEVDAHRHHAADVGDEPLMMARHVPVVVARDRVAGAAYAQSDGASVIVMDDGFQNPALAKELSLVVIDAHRGLGNGGVLPAGPLRAPLSLQLSRTDALIVVGEGSAADPVIAAVAARKLPVFRARLVPDPSVVEALRGHPVLAFAGIGDPARFVRTLKASGIEVLAERAFPDHHPYTRAELAELIATADQRQLKLVTTEKDLSRLRSDPDLKTMAADIAGFPVSLRFEEEAALRALVSARLRAANEARLSRNHHN
jgi:tetraacyldisaccharide 4'-kinase